MNIQDRMSNPNNADKWQIPKKKVGKPPVLTALAFGEASSEVKAKFRELYPVSTNKDMHRWFGISESSVTRIAKAEGLEKAEEYLATCRIAYLRALSPERRAEVSRRRSDIMKKAWQRAHREQLYGMMPTTRLRAVSLPLKQRQYKYGIICRFGYFSDPDHPYWVCYDSQTRRSAKVEANAVARGFKIVEGAD